MSEPAFLEGPSWPRQGEWTYDAYRRLPDDGRRYEVVRGFLYVSPAPSFAHQFAVWQLIRLLGNFVMDNKLGILLLAPFDIRLPGGIASPVQPDVAFVKKGNQPLPSSGSFEGVPDMVVEVLSPGGSTAPSSLRPTARLESRRSGSPIQCHGPSRCSR